MRGLLWHRSLSGRRARGQRRACEIDLRGCSTCASSLCGAVCGNGRSPAADVDGLLVPIGWRRGFGAAPAMMVPRRRGATNTTLAATQRHPCRSGMVTVDCARPRSRPETMVASGGTEVDELIPYGDWRKKLEEAERCATTSDDRKMILVDAFGESLAKIGDYNYVAETTVLKPRSDRPLYCRWRAPAARCELRGGARQPSGFNNSVRGDEMGPNDLETNLAAEKVAAERLLLELTPVAPSSVTYEVVWPRVLAKHIVRVPDVNRMAARLRKEGSISFPEWERGKRVPQPHYRMQRPIRRP